MATQKIDKSIQTDSIIYNSEEEIECTCTDTETPYLENVDICSGCQTTIAGFKHMDIWQRLNLYRHFNKWIRFFLYKDGCIPNYLIRYVGELEKYGVDESIID